MGAGRARARGERKVRNAQTSSRMKTPTTTPLHHPQTQPTTNPEHKGPRNKAKITKANEPRPPVFTARIVLLGAPSPEWAAGVRDRLLKEGRSVGKRMDGWLPVCCEGFNDRSSVHAMRDRPLSPTPKQPPQNVHLPARLDAGPRAGAPPSRPARVPRGQVDRLHAVR